MGRSDTYVIENGAKGGNRGRGERPKDDVVFVRRPDATIIVTMLLLTAFGVLMIFSSSYYKSVVDTRFTMFQFIRTQGIAIAIGLIFCFIAASVDYRKLLKFVGFFVYALAIGLLIITPFIGDARGGAERWIQIGAFSLQPSEIAKAAVIMVMAWFVSENKDRAKTLIGHLQCGVIVGIPALLTFLGNSFSSALTIVIIGAGIIFVASPYFWRYVLFVAGAGAAAISAMLLLPGFRQGRLIAWLDPFDDPSDKGFQTVQSLYAIASGGLFGLGLGNSKQKLIYMPEAHTDFIFAVICEELGFFGAALLLLTFGILIWRGIKVAINARELYGTLLAAGVVIQIAAQVMINVSVVTNFIPNTGVPLPFISYGGTSIIIVLSLIGILLNVSRYSKKY